MIVAYMMQVDAANGSRLSVGRLRDDGAWEFTAEGWKAIEIFQQWTGQRIQRIADLLSRQSYVPGSHFARFQYAIYYFDQCDIQGSAIHIGPDYFADGTENPVHSV